MSHAEPLDHLEQIYNAIEEFVSASERKLGSRTTRRRALGAWRHTSSPASGLAVRPPRLTFGTTPALGTSSDNRH